MLVAALVAEPAQAKNAVARAPLVFGDARGWVVLSLDGKLLQRFNAVCGARPEDLAVSTDLKTSAFTLWNAEAQNSLLYACDEGATQPRLLGERSGYHAQPSFSSDGSWVYFVHHPKKGGPPGQHEAGANAQLYRVRVDGSRLEALTDSKGCKLGPRPIGDDLVVLVHATCSGPRTIEVLRVSDRNVLMTAAESRLTHYPDVSPDGRRVLMTEQRHGAVELVELDLKTKRSRVLRELGEGYEGTRARWSGDGAAVFFQQGGTVLRVAAGGQRHAEKIADLGDAK